MQRKDPTSAYQLLPPDYIMPVQRRRRSPRNFLGTKKRQPRAGRIAVPQPAAPTAATNSKDYNAKYPPDEPLKELDETARVWRIYGDEALEVDDEMIQEYNESIDILLVFVRFGCDEEGDKLIDV